MTLVPENEEHMKYILVIGDGMADNPVPALGNKTPLQAAHKPCIDALAARGVVGHVLNVPKGLPAGSETAILSIFGCDPRKYFTGRSPMEAAASGIRLQPGDVAYRCNLITLEDAPVPMEQRKILSHSAGSIEGEDALAVVSVLEADEEFSALLHEAKMTIHHFPAFRQLAVQQGADIRGLKLTPPHDHLDEVCGPYLPVGCANASLLLKLMQRAHQVLDQYPINQRRRSEGKLPANGIWFWAEGTAVQLPQFKEVYGHHGAVISAVPLCQGIAVLTGLDVAEVPGATGELDTNFEGKMEKAVQLICGEDDFVAVHIEAPDECTHDGDLPGKIQAIEWIDSRLLQPMLQRIDQEDFDYRLLLLSDHKTLTATRGHDGDPVPYLLYQKSVDTGFGGVYDEDTGEKGPCVEQGADLMKLLFQQ